MTQPTYKQKAKVLWIKLRLKADRELKTGNMRFYARYSDLAKRAQDVWLRGPIC